MLNRPGLYVDERTGASLDANFLSSNWGRNLRLAGQTWYALSESLAQKKGAALSCIYKVPEPGIRCLRVAS